MSHIGQFFSRTKGCLISGFYCTGLGERVGPRLRESRLPTPSGRGGEFTQPRARSFAQPCISISW